MIAETVSKDSAAFFAWRRPDAGAPFLSVVAPMLNEEDAARALPGEIAAALHNVRHEIIVVDDGSTDGTLDCLREAMAAHPQLRIVRHERRAGQSRALRTGVLAARGEIVATLDGDGQNDPADIPSLLAALADNTALVMAAGVRRGRRDGAVKMWSSGVANKIRRLLLNDGAVDTGCGLKVFYREAYLRLPYFDHMHRYLPALMAREGYAVAYFPVSHRPRAGGVSKYGVVERLAVAFRDILGVMWLKNRAKSPGRVSEEP